MKTLFRLLAISVCLSFTALLASAQAPVTTSELTLPINLGNFPSIIQVSTQLVGNPGPQTVYYWIIVNTTFGQSSPYGAYLQPNVPNTLSSSNYVKITPIYPTGIVSLDVLKTSSPTPPSAACNCAVATGVTSGSVSDQSNSTSSYTIAPIAIDPYQITLDSEVTGAGASHPFLRQVATGTAIDLFAISGIGTVTNFSAGSLSPLFTTSVTNPTSTPALSFSLSSAAANTIFGNLTGSLAAPSFVTTQGTDSKVMTAGTVSGSAGTAVCLDSNSGLTTTGCTSSGITGSGTSGFIPEWNGASSLTNSTIKDVSSVLYSGEPFRVESNTGVALTQNSPFQVQSSPTALCGGGGATAATFNSNLNGVGCNAALFNFGPPTSSGGMVVGGWAEAVASAFSSTPAMAGLYGLAESASAGGSPNFLAGIAGQGLLIQQTSGTPANVVGLVGLGSIGPGDTQTATVMAGVTGQVTNDSGGNGNVTQPFGAAFYAASPEFSSGGTPVISHVYGLYVADQTAGGSTQNPSPYAIYTTGSAPSLFGGNLTVAGASVLFSGLSGLPSSGDYCAQLSSTGALTPTGSACNTSNATVSDGSGTTTANEMVLSTSTAHALGYGAQVLYGTSPTLTVTAAAAGDVGAEFNTASSPTADILDLDIAGTKTDWFDNSGNLHTVAATIGGNLTLAGISPWIDVTDPTYGAKGDALFNNTGGTSTTSGTTTVTTASGATSWASTDCTGGTGCTGTVNKLIVFQSNGLATPTLGTVSTASGSLTLSHACFGITAIRDNQTLPITTTGPSINGESLMTAENCSTLSSKEITMTAPTLPSGATGYRVYFTDENGNYSELSQIIPGVSNSMCSSQSTQNVRDGACDPTATLTINAYTYIGFPPPQVAGWLSTITTFTNGRSITITDAIPSDISGNTAQIAWGTANDAAFAAALTACPNYSSAPIAGTSSCIVYAPPTNGTTATSGRYAVQNGITTTQPVKFTTGGIMSQEENSGGVWGTPQSGGVIAVMGRSYGLQFGTSTAYLTGAGAEYLNIADLGHVGYGGVFIRGQGSATTSSHLFFEKVVTADFVSGPCWTLAVEQISEFFEVKGNCLTGVRGEDFVSNNKFVMTDFDGIANTPNQATTGYAWCFSLASNPATTGITGGNQIDVPTCRDFYMGHYRAKNTSETQVFNAKSENINLTGGASCSGGTACYGTYFQVDDVTNSGRAFNNTTVGDAVARFVNLVNFGTNTYNNSMVHPAGVYNITGTVCTDNGTNDDLILGSGLSSSLSCVNKFSTALTIAGALSVTPWASALTGQIFYATNGAQPAFTSPALTDSTNSPISLASSSYTIAVDSSTALVDRTHTLRITTAGSNPVTIPCSTASGASGLVVTLKNVTTSTVTVNATTTSCSDTITVSGGLSPTSGVTTFALPAGQEATLNQAATNLWEASLTGGGGGLESSSGVGLSATGTSYAPLLGVYSSTISTEANAQQISPSGALAISNLQVTLSTATGSGQTVAVTLRAAGSSQSVTCTVGNSSTTCSDTTHSYSVSAGTLLDWQVVVSSGTFSGNVYIGAAMGATGAISPVNLPLTYRVVAGTITATSSPGTTVLQTGTTDLLANKNYDVTCDIAWTTPTTSTAIYWVGAITVNPASPGWTFFGFEQDVAAGAIASFNATVNPNQVTTTTATTIGSSTSGDTGKHFTHWHGTIPTNATSASQFVISAYVGSNSLTINAGGCTFVATQN